MLYVERTTRTLNFEYIHDEMIKGTWNAKLPKAEQQQTRFRTNSTRETDFWTPNEDKIQIRLLCHKSIPKYFNREHLSEYHPPADPRPINLFRRLLNSAFSKGVSHEDTTQFDSLIFHIHGGGFVAMSSESHQNYTRK